MWVPLYGDTLNAIGRDRHALFRRGWCACLIAFAQHKRAVRADGLQGARLADLLRDDRSIVVDEDIQRRGFPAMLMACIGEQRPRNIQVPGRIARTIGR